MAPPPLAEPPAPPSGAGTESDDDWARLLGFLSKGESLEWLGPVPTDEDHEVSEFAWNTEAGEFVPGGGEDQEHGEVTGPSSIAKPPDMDKCRQASGPRRWLETAAEAKARVEAGVTMSEELSTSSASARCGRRWPEGGGWN